MSKQENILIDQFGCKCGIYSEKKQKTAPN